MRIVSAKRLGIPQFNLEQTRSQVLRSEMVRLRTDPGDGRRAANRPGEPRRTRAAREGRSGMRRSASNILRFRWLLNGLAVVLCSACGGDPPPDPGPYLPDSKDAYQAVEKGLRAWQGSPQNERTPPAGRPVMFVDQQRPPGQRLRKFEILGESPRDKGCRRFPVRLVLEGPDESLVVSYYVFGRDPIWVYRAEDFDMMMHMDRSMMAAPAADATGTRDDRGADPLNRDPAPPVEASEGGIRSRGSP